MWILRSAYVGVARIVRDHADRRAVGVQLRQQRHHLLAVLRVEVTRRLVREQDRRAADERARNRDALLLTARELRRIVVQAMRHAHALERFDHALLALLAFMPARYVSGSSTFSNTVRSPIRLNA